MRFSSQRTGCSDVESLDSETFVRLLTVVPDCLSLGGSSTWKDLPLAGCMYAAAPRGGEKTLNVTAGERYRLALTDCASGLLTLSDENAAVVAEAASPRSADCAALEHEFSTAGTYTVSWSMVRADAVDEWAWIYGERLDD